MTPETGKQRITVVTACLNASGMPDFAMNVAEVTAEEYENGIHLYFVEADLLEAGYEEPFVHFSDREAPAFLVPAVKEYLGAPAGAIASIPSQSEGGQQWPASSK